MPTYYLGKTHDGRVVSRKSTRCDFTHAAIYDETDYGVGTPNTLPSFGTSRQGAVTNFENGWGRGKIGCEVVELRQVSSAEYRKETSGIDPYTGRKRIQA